MQNGNFILKTFAESLHILICQRYLRHQKDSLLSGPQHLFDQMHIDHRLAAAGDPVQQYGTRLILFPLSVYFIHHTGLLAGENGQVSAFSQNLHGHRSCLVLYPDQTFFFEVFYYSCVQFKFFYAGRVLRLFMF